MFKSNAERQEKLTKLIDWLREQPDGQRLSWVEIEQGAGVRMHRDNGAPHKEHRDLVRVALKKLKRAASAIHGSGIELSSAGNAVSFADEARTRVRSAVVRQAKRLGFVRDRHESEMAPDKRLYFASQQAMLGAIQQGIEGRPTKKLERAVPPPGPMLPKKE